MKSKNIAKRRLSDINFEKEGSHIALVSEEQGHGANGHHYALVMKATENLSDSFLEKASKVKVTMEITDYLERFFNLYSSEAELLARALGFTTDNKEENDPDYSYYQDWIESQLASIEVMKSLKDSENIANVLAALDENKYLDFLNDQSKVEKCLNRIDLVKNLNTNKNSKQKLVLKKDVNDSKIKVNKNILKEINEGSKNMSKNTVQVIEHVEEVEVVTKAQYDELLKSVSDKEALLTKALAEVEQYKLEKAAVIAKARKDQLVNVCGLETAEIVFKACEKAEDVDFELLVKRLSLFKDQVENSNLFKEVGASAKVEAETKSESVSKAFRARYE